MNFSCQTGTSSSGSYSGTGLGAIATRDSELAGPNSADGSVTVTNGFNPCAYKAPTTGVYGVLFTGTPNGIQQPEGSIDPLKLGRRTVAAWDVTVRDSATSVADINGRLFTYAWVGFTGANSLPVYHTLYYVTSDGLRYKQDLTGLDPNAYAVGQQFRFPGQWPAVVQGHPW